MRRSAAAVPRPAVRRAAYCLPARRCAARAPAVEECADALTRPAGCPGGRQPGGATRGAGERSLSRQTERREKVAVRARRALAGVHEPRVAARRCQRGQPEAQRRWSYALSRLVILEFTRTYAVIAGTCCLCMAALLRVAVVLAASLPKAVKGRCYKTLSFLLSIHFLYPRTCLVAVVADAGFGAALPAGRGTAAALPRMALSPHTPSPFGDTYEFRSPLTRSC